jgi:hypothetical protein
MVEGLLNEESLRFYHVVERAVCPYTPESTSITYLFYSVDVASDLADSVSDNGLARECFQRLIRQIVMEKQAACVGQDRSLVGV